MSAPAFERGFSPNDIIDKMPELGRAYLFIYARRDELTVSTSDARETIFLSARASHEACLMSTPSVRVEGGEGD